MFFSSTRVTLMPHLSDASSRIEGNFGIDNITGSEGRIEIEITNNVTKGGSRQVFIAEIGRSMP